MKKYTINEIDEIRARALFIKDRVGHYLEYEEYREVYLDRAKAIREADEKGGVLIITDDKKVKDGDLVKSTYKLRYEPDFWLYKECYDEKTLKHTIIQRNKTPVYQCKKEEQNEKTN